MHLLDVFMAGNVSNLKLIETKSHEYLVISQNLLTTHEKMGENFVSIWKKSV